MADMFDVDRLRCSNREGRGDHFLIWTLITASTVILFLSIRTSALWHRIEGLPVSVEQPKAVGVVEGKSVEIDVTIRSLRDEAIEIVGVSIPCSCIARPDLPATIEPNGVHSLRFEIDSSGMALGKNELLLNLFLDSETTDKAYIRLLIDVVADERPSVSILGPPIDSLPAK